MGFSQRLPTSFYERLHRDIRARMAERGIGLLILDAADDVLYTTGFSFRPNERPVALALTASDTILLLPELEREHAARQAVAAETLVYFEFPGVERAFSLLARSLGRVSGDVAHSHGLSVARAGELAALFPDNRVVASDIVSGMRQVKYPEEIALHREAARISDAMVTAGVDLVTDLFRAGKPLPSEITLEAHVVRSALDIMESEHDEIMNVNTLAGGLVYGGPNSAYPHGIISSRRITPGESFILSLGCRVGGRAAESERTFILGEPSIEHESYYRIASEAQAIGTAGLVAGRTCASADIAALSFIREAGMTPYLKHRVGHGMGVAFHEPPWVEAGDQTVLVAGMICSSEPALYVPEVGGFRLADTVLVTEHGPEPLTNSPRRFEEIVLS
ncbi:M24 family metallopeptidase [Martelella endophytica]|uniref:Proline dipeptidase n=1 Tax=Martelella endophytica TaxID=1486262 RepID=A0A0D5LLC3_MAREN|nr:Xaa-Pro peptidase family protein [Martelella endophytica]AJY44946.1 proline dipeptidase [Martelella endophytica]